MALLGWIIAVFGFAGGGYLTFKKFIAPDESIWEFFKNRSSAKDKHKGEKRKEEIVSKTKEETLKVLKELHDEESERNIILNFIRKIELTKEEFSTFKNVFDKYFVHTLKIYNYKANLRRKARVVKKILEKENSEIGNKTGVEIRKDWKEEYDIIEDLLKKLENLINGSKTEIKFLVFLKKIIKMAGESKEEKVILFKQGERGRIEDILKRILDFWKFEYEIERSISADEDKIKEILDKEREDIKEEDAKQEPQK